LLFTLQPAVRTLNGILAFPKPAQAAGYLYLSGLHPGRPFRCFSGPPQRSDFPQKGKRMAFFIHQPQRCPI